MSELVEEWRTVKDYINYMVSNYGRVKSVKFNKERILKQTLRKDGYIVVGLYKNGKIKQILVHQLVLKEFLYHVIDGNNLVINHINGIKTDNRVENLEIVTQRENCSTCSRKDRYTKSSTLPGASLCNLTKKWRSHYLYNGKHYSLGSYNTDKEASDKWYEAYEADKNGTFEIFNLQFKHNNKSGIIQYTKEGEFIKEWSSVTEAGKILNIFQQSISTCCRGKQKSAYGFIWKYKDM